MGLDQQQPTAANSPSQKDFQNLSRQFVIRLVLLSMTMLIIGAGASYIFLVTKQERWLFLGGGLLLLTVLALWQITRSLKQDLSRLQAVPQPRADQSNQGDIASKATIPAAGDHRSGEQLDQLTAPQIEQSQEPNFKLTEPDFEKIREEFCRLSGLDAEGIAIHKKISLVDANQALAMMFGYTPLELADLTLVDLSAPESHSTVLRNTLIKYEMPYEAIGLKKDGATFPIEILSQAMPHNGQMVRVVGIREISERSEAEVLEALRQAKQNLEARVEESTSELRYANERLQVELNEREKTKTELIQRNRELTILQSASIAITSTLDLRYVLDTVTQEMAKLFEVEDCSISEWNPEENTISMIAKYGPTGWWHPRLLSQVRSLADYPLTKEILEEPVPEQLTISQTYLDPAEAAYMQEANLKTRLMVPMLFHRRVVGLVELTDSRVERTFTYHEISLAKLLASQAASAIENARLYEQAQQEIMERKQAEADLEEERALLAERVKERTSELSKANAELARAARLKDEFLAAMSHELRTPLNAVLGSAEILRDEVFGPLNDKQLKYSRNIEESGRHLLELINDILDLSKIEAGKMELDLGQVSVKSVCDASLRLVKQLAHKKELQLKHQIDENAVTLVADERRLKQILVNLLSNAIKFTPEGGKIGLDVAGDEGQQAVHFTVWDSGIGISQEDMGRLFQPFVQLDSKLSRQYAGTGLGLSLVSRMTEMHGGGISVESEVGQGSRFTVSLPWPEATDPGAADSGLEPPIVERGRGLAPKADGSQWSILLADDNEENIDLLVGYLEAQQYRLTVARDGREAINRAKEEKPDLILMDVQMPGMDGLEATRRLREDALLATVPVIAVTALAMPGDRERCIAAGANEYLSKPVNLQGLVRTIEQQLNRYRLEEESSA